MNEKLIENYFKMLHPEYETLSSDEQSELMFDIDFISEYINEIDALYCAAKRPNTLASKQGLSDQKILSNIVRRKKIDKYFNLLHPEFDSLTPSEQARLIDEKIFISNNIEDIDKFYHASKKPTAHAYQEGFSDQKILSIAVNRKKIDNYFNLLYPDFDSLTPSEQAGLIDERIFIANNIDEIDEYYHNAIFSTYEELSESRKQEILQNAVNTAKQKNATLTPSDIEQSTQGVKIESFKQSTETLKDSVQETSNEKHNKGEDVIPFDD